ncbi:proteasome inhibitor PI31 subunit-like [Acropora millepora]|uniref:proteasome inhibitor PI31 subunit-like n=1 Tax=Acropora millepora TaxID=45264 RepID=UPI001CF5546C|nr:proteasome inhibitor PI31 subunit-like [Acropora millepora]XP_044181582.1 proteasome inhibitor PI31 subunit-like [Acropora millepora]
MAEVKLKNLLRLSRPRNKFDAVILAVHSCLAERGFRCINSGEERNSQQECDFGETLPPDWNSLDGVYALQYRRGNLNSVFIFKALILGNKIMVYLMEEDESKMHDTELDVDAFTCESVHEGSLDKVQQSTENIFRRFDHLRSKVLKDVVDKFSANSSRRSSEEERRERSTSNQSRQPSRLIDDDPLRIPPRRPPGSFGEWQPVAGPFGYGDGDRMPGHPGVSGGMVMDPFRSGGMGSMGGDMFRPPRNPGQLPRGAVPPGARFDPFGPVPPGGSRTDSRSGRFAGPDSDHLPPPGYDDMFM